MRLLCGLSFPACLQVSAEAGHLQGLQLDRLERALVEQQRSADAELERVQRSTKEAAEVAIHTAVEEARAEMRVGTGCLQAGVPSPAMLPVHHVVQG